VKIQKTNALRIIESASVPYETYSYSVEEDALDAITVANKIGAPAESVFKTLIVVSDKNTYYTFVIPGNFELNLKKSANVASAKKLELLPLKELQPLTGYIRGGCSPIGMKKLFPTFIDETAQLHDFIFVSAGVRGLQVKIKPNDLLRLTNGIFADLV